MIRLRTPSRSGRPVASRIMILALFSFLVFAFAIPAVAQAPRASFSSQESLVSEFDVNGLKVILKRRPNSATVAGGLFIRGGANNINAKNAGIEQLMLATAIEAGKNITRSQLRRELATKGSAFGAAATNDFSAVTMATTKPDFERVFDLFAGVMLDPAFADEDLKRDRDQMIAALRESVATPDGALASLQEKAIYAGHPYANPVNGTAATLQSFTAADLRAYHKRMMETQRLLFVFVGDIDPEMLRTKIAATFGKLPRGEYKTAPVPAADFSKATFDFTQRAIPTQYLKGVFAAPSPADPDYYAMRVAIAVLQTLVFQEVRGRLQLSYAPDAELDDLAANTANFSVSTTEPNRAVEAIQNQIKFLKERTLNQEAIEEIASFFLTRHYMSQERSGAQVAELARFELVGGGWRNSFKFLDGVRAVTGADVQRVASKYMTNIRYVYVGDPKLADRKIFAVGE